MHKNHKIVEVSDVESLQKENITLETSTKNFDNLFEKTNPPKKKLKKK